MLALLALLAGLSASLPAEDAPEKKADAPEKPKAPQAEEKKAPSGEALQRELQALRNEVEQLRGRQERLTEALAAQGNDAARAKLAEDPTLPAEKLISDEVVARLLRSRDHELARTGMLLIRKNPTPARVEALMNFARNPDAHVHLRYAAIEQLGALSTPDTLKVLLVLLEDQNEGIVSRCASSLGRTGDTAYFAPLLKRLTGTDWKEKKDRGSEARRALVYALGQLKDKNATPVVLDVMRNSPYEETQRYACLALRNLMDPSAVPSLLDLAHVRKLTTTDKYDRLDEELIKTLATLKDKRAGQLFIECLSARDYKLRDHVARYLDDVCGADHYDALTHAWKGEWAAALAGERRHNQLSGLAKAIAATGRPGAGLVLLQPLTEGMNGSLARDTANLIRQVAQPEHGPQLVAAYPKIEDRSTKAEIARLLNEGKYNVAWDKKKKVFYIKPPEKKTAKKKAPTKETAAAKKPEQDKAPKKEAKQEAKQEIKKEEKKDQKGKEAQAKKAAPAKQAAQKPPAPPDDGEQF